MLLETYQIQENKVKIAVRRKKFLQAKKPFSFNFHLEQELTADCFTANNTCSYKQIQRTFFLLMIMTTAFSFHHRHMNQHIYHSRMNKQILHAFSVSPANNESRTEIIKNSFGFSQATGAYSV